MGFLTLVYLFVVLYNKNQNRGSFFHHLFFPIPSGSSWTDRQAAGHADARPPKPGAGEGETQKGGRSPLATEARAAGARHGPWGDQGCSNHLRACFLENNLQSCRNPGTAELQSWQGLGCPARPLRHLTRDLSRAASPLAVGNPSPRAGHALCFPVSLGTGGLSLAGAEAGLSDETAARRASLVPLPRTGKPSETQFCSEQGPGAPPCC